VLPVAGEGVAAALTCLERTGWSGPARAVSVA
jgi:hypothetical protein